MLSKTLIVCLLAFLCLTLATAERLNTRIAGSTTANTGQFPYIAFLSYNYVDATTGVSTSQQFTGIIYSKTSVITTASNFDNFPSTGATLIVEVGATDINQPAVPFYTVTGTIATYDLTAGGAVPTATIIIPTQYVAGNAANNIAIVRLSGTDQFDITNAEIKIANFPTSSPLQGDDLIAVAYGNQVANGATYPVLKYATLNKMKNTRCQSALTGGSPDLSAQFDTAQHFCIRSVALAQSNNIFEGVCKLDIGGAVVRTSNPTDPTVYYEVVGLIAFADDANTCNPDTRLPAVVTYLSYFQETFFTPILGSLSAVGNGQDPAQNEDSANGNFICGNGIVESPYEDCDPTTADADSTCCSVNTCKFKPSGKLCNGAKKSDPADKCVQKSRCGADGQCLARNKPDGKKCSATGTCQSGSCSA